MMTSCWLIAISNWVLVFLHFIVMPTFFVNSKFLMYNNVRLFSLSYVWYLHVTHVWILLLYVGLCSPFTLWIFIVYIRYSSIQATKYLTSTIILWSSITDSFCDPAWKNRTCMHKIHPFTSFHVSCFLCKLRKICKLHCTSHCCCSSIKSVFS